LTVDTDNGDFIARPALRQQKDTPPVTTLSLPENTQTGADGLRPVNLRTDLAPLADLIELVFADSMDSSGAAAVREMRQLSRMGVGLGLLPGLNDLLQGISLGFVWVADNRLVGNVSVYPARWPGDHYRTWIIANVGVHPDYQRRGIATRLMQASMEMIRQRGGARAVLQVDADNDGARRIYERLGFITERTWTTWRRSSAARIPPPLNEQAVFLSRRRRGEWQSEYDLARRLRPAERGGLGWQRPLHISFFHKPLWQQLGDLFNMRGMERIVIRSADESRILAALWIENGFLVSSTQLTLLVDPAYQGIYDEVLINHATRRYDTRSALVIEHPSDETITADVLRRYYFRPQREVVHMRWDVR
jgi:ribosomal protein S18 acetylase RimI-like enzyme